MSAKPAADRPFVHLHVHSSYSLLEGALTDRAAGRACQEGPPAGAGADRHRQHVRCARILRKDGGLPASSRSSAARSASISATRKPAATARGEPCAAHRAARRARGRLSQPDAALLARLSRHRAARAPAHQACLARRRDRRTDRAHRRPGRPARCRDRRRPERACALARCEELQRLFGDRLYIELQRHGTPAERTAEPALIELAYARGIPLVATNEPFFATARGLRSPRRAAVHRRRQAHRRRRTPPAHGGASLQEPRRNGALCSPICRRRWRPPSRSPSAARSARARWRRSCRASPPSAARRSRRGAGAAPTPPKPASKRRLARYGIAQGHTAEEYHERLDFELGVIARMKYAGYFLIVADFIQWAKAQGIPVGPGRGSGAGSLVAYALTITDLDPIRFGLLFERFLNPERISMPDFDIDFCQDRRDEVIRYVQERYGRDRVAQIITFGTLQARGVLRDVGRVLQMPYGQVDKLCKLVPQNPANPVTLKRAIDGRAAAAGRARPRSGHPARLRHRAEARRLAPPRLDARRRHRHRRAVADRTGAALSRSEIADAGDPVQHEMGRAGGPGEIRLSRPEDAHRARPRGQAGAAARHRHRSVQHLRSTTPRPTRCWRAARRSACSRWKVRACGARWSICARTVSRI